MTLSSENRILFLAAAGSRNSNRIAQELSADLDWAAILRMGTIHKAIPALSRLLEGARAADVPPEVMQLFRRQRMVSDMHMFHLQQRLQESAATLATRCGTGRVILLKGAALGAGVYKNFAERPMADIDLLIRAEDASAAAAALEQTGWIPESDPLIAARYDGHHHLPPYLDARGSGHRIELHTSPLPLDNPFGTVAEDMWTHAAPAPAPLDGLLIPARGQLFVHACIHFAWSHMVGRGAWRTFQDIGALMQTPEHWEEGALWARRWKGESCCYWTLRLARSLAEMDVPRELLASLRPPQPRFLEEMLTAHLTSQVAPWTEDTLHSVRTNDLLWKLAIRPAWSRHNRGMPERDNKKWIAPGNDTVVDQPRNTALHSAYAATRSARYLARLAAMSLKSLQSSTPNS